MQMKKITRQQIKVLEKYLDRIWSEYGIDIDLARKHFGERLNDPRNGEQISLSEIQKIFTDIKQKFGSKLKNASNLEAVMKDLSSNINIPFVMVYDKKNDEIDLIAKTVMRKENFRTSNKTFVVENVTFKEFLDEKRKREKNH